MTLSPLQMYINELRTTNMVDGPIEIITDTAKSSKPRNNHPQRRGRRLSLSRWESAPHLDESSYSLPSLRRKMSNSSDEGMSALQSQSPAPVDSDRLDRSEHLDTSTHSLPSTPYNYENSISQMVSSRGSRTMGGLTGTGKGSRRKRRESLDTSFKPCFQSRNVTSELSSVPSKRSTEEMIGQQRGSRRSRRASLDSLHSSPAILDSSPHSSLQLDNSESLDISSHSLPTSSSYGGGSSSSTQMKSGRTKNMVATTGSGRGGRRARRGSLDSSFKPCFQSRNVSPEIDSSPLSKIKDETFEQRRGRRPARRASLDSGFTPTKAKESSRLVRSPSPPRYDDNIRQRCFMRSAKGTRNLGGESGGAEGRRRVRRASLDASFQPTDRWNTSSELDVSKNSTRNMDGETTKPRKTNRASRRASIDCLPSLPTRNDSLTNNRNSFDCLPSLPTRNHSLTVDETAESPKKGKQTFEIIAGANCRSPRRSSLDSIMSLDEHFRTCSASVKVKRMDGRSIADSLELNHLKKKDRSRSHKNPAKEVASPTKRKEIVDGDNAGKQNDSSSSSPNDSLQTISSLPRCDSPTSLDESSHSFSSPTSTVARMLVNAAC